jgi:putative intracellular protease/amidase
VKEVLLVLTNRWADWEASFAVSVINSVPMYKVKTIAIDNLPKVSIGGIRAEIDYSIKEYQQLDNLAMIILPGGYSWKEDQHEEIANFVQKVSASHIPVAAICGATIFLGKWGFLNSVNHTGDDLDLFQKEKGYNGQDYYVSAQVVVDKGFITANETASVEFAYEIFKILKVDEAQEIEIWYDNFSNGTAR